MDKFHDIKSYFRQEKKKKHFDTLLLHLFLFMPPGHITMARDLGNAAKINYGIMLTKPIHRFCYWLVLGHSAI